MTTSLVIDGGDFRTGYISAGNYIEPGLLMELIFGTKSFQYQNERSPVPARDGFHRTGFPNSSIPDQTCSSPLSESLLLKEAWGFSNSTNLWLSLKRWRNTGFRRTLHRYSSELKLTNVQRTKANRALIHLANDQRHGWMISCTCVCICAPNNSFYNPFVISSRAFWAFPHYYIQFHSCLFGKTKFISSQVALWICIQHKQNPRCPHSGPPILLLWF